MVRYQRNSDAITPDQLTGFFVGWPNPPSAETHLRLLDKSDHVVLAIDDQSGNVVGFITAIVDGDQQKGARLLDVMGASGVED